MIFEGFIQSATMIGALLIALCSGALSLHLIASLANGLFRVGRSEEQVAEILGRYSLFEQLCLEHVFKESDFADEFSILLVIYYHCGLGLMLLECLLTLPALFNTALSVVMAWIAVALVLVFYVPALIFHLYISWKKLF